MSSITSAPLLEGGSKVIQEDKDLENKRKCKCNRPEFNRTCMKKCCIRCSFCVVFTFFVLVITAVIAELTFEETNVGSVVFPFHEGEEIWSHRIPVMLRVPPINGTNETLLIFAEGRSRESDEGPKRLSFRRSTDSGETWTPVETLFRDEDRDWLYDGLSVGAAVYDNITGNVWLHFCVGAHENAPTHRDHFVMSSPDLGLSWTEPKSINKAILDGTGGKVKMWMGGPASGVQLDSGRLVVCGWYNWNSEQQGGDPNNAGSMVMISDDHGVTWVPGGRISRQSGVNPNECQVALLPSGDLIMNMRDADGRFSECSCRLQSISEDGGLTWSKPVQVPDLTTPVCQGSIIHSDTNNKLYYTGPRSDWQRKNGVIMQSLDNGEKWSEYATIEKRDFGYSEIVQLTNGDFGVIFESSAACDNAMFANPSTFFQCLVNGWGRVFIFMTNEIRFTTIPGPQ